MKKSASGFTLVELLIVIVVIAVLATITAVTYSGIQTRSKNTQTITAVSQYLKALKLYAVDKGSIDNLLSDLPGNTICLGTASDYKADATYVSNGAGECGWINNGPTITVNPDRAAPLLAYMGGKSPAISVAGGWYQSVRGIQLRTFGWGGGEFSYGLFGDTTCLPGFTKKNFGLTWCTASLRPDGSITS